MKDEMIDELIVNESSSYSEIEKEFARIQENYLEKFRKEFEIHFANDTKLLEEERAIYKHICEMIKEDTFLHMMGNYSYRGKLEEIFENEEYVLGKSKIKLLKLEYTLKSLCDSYIKEFREFVNDSKSQLETGLEQIDADTKQEMRSIFDTKINSIYFFNELYDSCLLIKPLGVGKC